jgi:hypothetical protein
MRARAHPGRGAAWPERLFLGDWHPIVRDPLDLLRVSFALGAAVLALRGDAHGAAQLLLSAAVGLLARVANVPRLFDWCVCVAMAFTGWGDALHLFSHVRWHEHAIHITMSFIFSVLLYLALARLDVVPDPAREAKPGSWLVGMGLITLWIGVTAATFYDIYEWVVGESFGQPLMVRTDAVSDALDGLIGSVAGGLVLAAWAAAELPTRRVPRRSPESRRGPGAAGSRHPQRRPESHPGGIGREIA